MTEILQLDDPMLRQFCAPVPENLFGTKELSGMLRAMEEALDAEPDGVALAANQIGIPYRIFIARYDRLGPEHRHQPQLPADIGVFINPEFVKSSRRRIYMEEGCLSVRRIYGRTLRHERATVRAYDEQGNVFERGGGGILAQIFQHETDHLNGMLFIDHAEDLIHTKAAQDGPVEV